MAATEFQRAVNEWKRTRDEWKRLTAAIKRGAETAELLELLPDAGCSNEEANALINLQRRATRPATAKDAKRFAVAEKAVAKLDEEIAALEKRRGLSKTSFERDELDSQIFDLAEKRQRANQDLATCRVAAAHIETATAAGVI